MAGLLKEKGTGPLFIVEGEIDAMTISEMCGFPAIGLGSTSNKKKLIEAVHEAKESILADKDKALIIVPDKDQGGHGQKKAEEMLKAIREEGVPALIAEIPTEREDKVDANQAYRDDSEGFRDFLGAAIEKAAEFAHDPEAVLKEEQAEKLKEYEKESQAAMLDNFEAWATRRAASPYIPTGFPFLDDHLNNGLREELYILGGVPSAGKTTFALNIADKIAERGDADVLYFSLEQGNYELTSKSLSRLTWVLSTQKEKDANLPRTNMGIIESYSFTGENEAQQRIINLRQRAVDRYKAFQGRIRIIEAGKLKAEDMTREIDRHYEATGRRPVVILDYLQKLEISNSRIIDAKPRIDQAVTDLKQLSRDKQVPVIAISSLNREGYAAPGMKNLKESGDLEYSADIVLLLGFRREKGDEDLEDYIDTQSKLNPREMFVKIAKNRNGVKGQKVNMDYYAAFNYFTDSDRQGNEIPDPPKSGKQKR